MYYANHYNRQSNPAKTTRGNNNSHQRRQDASRRGRGARRPEDGARPSRATEEAGQELFAPLFTFDPRGAVPVPLHGLAAVARAADFCDESGNVEVQEVSTWEMGRKESEVPVVVAGQVLVHLG